jgi:hypothetical protein
MLVIWAGTPKSSKLAESDLMKVPAQVVAPIYQMSAWQQGEREGDNHSRIRPPYTRGEFGNQWLPEGLQPDGGPFCMQGIMRSLSDIT